MAWEVFLELSIKKTVSSEREIEVEGGQEELSNFSKLISSSPCGKAFIFLEI